MRLFFASLLALLSMSAAVDMGRGLEWPDPLTAFASAAAGVSVGWAASVFAGACFPRRRRFR